MSGLSSLSRRGQSGTEYIIVTGFALLVLTPFIYLLFTYSQGYEAETSGAQVSGIGRELFATVDRVYHSGPPSKLTVQVRMPEGITNMTIRRNSGGTCTKCTELLFGTRIGGEVVVSTNIDVRGYNPPTHPTATDTVYSFNSTYTTAGTKRFTLEAVNDYVMLGMQ